MSCSIFYIFLFVFVFKFSSAAVETPISVCVVDSLTLGSAASCDGKTASVVERSGGETGPENALTYFLYKKLNEGYKIINVAPNEKTGSAVYTLIKSK